MANLPIPRRLGAGKPSHEGLNRPGAQFPRGTGVRTSVSDPTPCRDDTDLVDTERLATVRALTQIMADLLLTTDPRGVFHESDRQRLVRPLTNGLTPYRELLPTRTPRINRPVTQASYGRLRRAVTVPIPQLP